MNDYSRNDFILVNLFQYRPRSRASWFLLSYSDVNSIIKTGRVDPQYQLLESCSPLQPLWFRRGYRRLRILLHVSMRRCTSTLPYLWLTFFHHIPTSRAQISQDSSVLEISRFDHAYCSRNWFHSRMMMVDIGQIWASDSCELWA